MLEINEDQPFQEKIWILQRIGWCLLILFLAAAALGFTGPSSLTQEMKENGGYRLEYPRFGRAGHSFEMIVSGPVREVFFSREILRKNELKAVLPIPLKGETRPGGMIFQFGNQGEGEIHFDWMPRSAGRLKGKVSVGNPPTDFEINQLVYF